jgi:L-amino acid N-acyltransferase YncA
MLSIREAEDRDSEAIWHIFHAVVAGGDSFVFDPDTTRDEALTIWCGPSMRVYVAEHDGRVVGSYFLKPNQPGLGSHVANAGYMVAPEARGLGVGRAMGEHSLIEARRLGYRGMQFNMVVSSNEAAVRLWTALGFSTVGNLPQAFRHATLGYVDAYIMYQEIV